jgi:glycosyltransferase involved in cell wall biosynthesis
MTNIESDIQTTDRLVIAFDAKRLFNNFTGLGNYSRTLVKLLQMNYPEHDYHLFAEKTPKNEDTAYFFDKEKFTIHRAGFKNPLWRSLGMSGSVNKLKPDIFHGLSHEIPFGLDPGIKTIVSFHDMIYEHFPAQFGAINSRLYRWKYRSSVRRAHHVVAISHSTKDDLIDFYKTPSTKLSVIYQSCSDRFANDEVNTDVKPSIKDYFLYVGSIIERKGLLQAVIAYGHLPIHLRRPFVVTGNGDKTYLKKVMDMITYYNLSRDFHFLKHVPHDQLVALYDHAYALVYPSIYEGFGIPIIESLSRAKPVITATLSSMPEAAGPGGILVDPYKYEDICDAMIKIQNPTIYEACAKSGRAYVSQKFDSTSICKEWMELYTSMAHQSINK